MSVADDLLAALSQEIQAAGPREVDNLSPASTRGTAEGSGPARRRQPGRAYVRVETAPPWPVSPPHIDPAAQHAAWDGWRAEVARRSIAMDAACAAPTGPYTPDGDHLELEHRRTFDWLVVRDGDGVVWRNVPPFEIEDLPQPVVVLERTVKRVYPEPKPKPTPIEALAEAKVDKRKQRSCMTDEQIEFALGLLAEGQQVGKVAARYWREWGFASEKSCDFSLRRRRGAAAQAAKFREEAIAA